MKRTIVSALCACIALASAYGRTIISNDVELVAEFKPDDGRDRVTRDVPAKIDMFVDGGVEFDLFCSDMVPVSHITVYFRSGEGWYSVAVDPGEEGKWEHVRLPQRVIRGVEGRPAGWSAISSVRFSAWRGDEGKAKVVFRNFSSLARKEVEALVVCGETCANKNESRRWFLEYAAKVTETFDALGIGVRQVADSELSAGHLEGIRLLVLPYNPRLPETAEKLVRSWGESGRPMLVCYSLPNGVADLIGVRPTGSWVVGEKGAAALGGFLRKGAGLADQPKYAVQLSHRTSIVEPLPGGEVVAEWAGTDRRSLGIPAIVKTPRAVFIGHVWYGGASRERLELMRSIAASLVPEWKARFAAARQKAKEDAAAVRIRAAALPDVKGERRLVWCHSAWGISGMDWDASAKFVKDCGFTDIIANLAWGGMAFYPSKVLATVPETAERGDALAQCLAACRRHGLKMHVWKVNWRLGHGATKEFVAKLEAAGRLQKKTGDGTANWLCPSNPINLAEEIDAMCELAEKGVDGVHFDYIRYPGMQSCFCDGCRERFEKSIGVKVADWPHDLSRIPDLHRKWIEFRCANITALVEGVAKRLRKTHPKTEISAAVFRNAAQDRVGVGQDWGRWCREGWLNFACPMDYTESTAVFRNQVRRQGRMSCGVPLYPGIGLSVWQEDGLAPKRMAEQIEVVREAGLTGFTVFNLDRHAQACLPCFNFGARRQGK